MSRGGSDALAARRRELREELERRRRAAAEELQRRRQAAGGPPPRRKRRWLWVLAALVAVLLVLLSDCTCAEEPVEVEVEVEVEGPPSQAPVPVEVVAAKRPPPRIQMERQDRPEYVSEVPEVLPWVASFQLQVEARSPRLAACFVGAVRPGRLKWTAAVEPGSGRVSEHTLEPTVVDEVLSKGQRTCVIAVLSEPPYRLELGEERATPSRVGLVIEF